MANKYNQLIEALLADLKNEALYFKKHDTKQLNDMMKKFKECGRSINERL